MTRSMMMITTTRLKIVETGCADRADAIEETMLLAAWRSV
jgi:hypothetical protein